MIYKKLVKTTYGNGIKAVLQSIGAGERVPYIAGRRVSATLDFGATTTTSDLTITCKGAKVGDQVILGSPAPPTKGFYTAFVSATDEVTVRLCSVDGTSLNPASATFIVTVIPTV